MAPGSETLGPYRLLRRIGVGGMAETFEATRPWSAGLEGRVCVKRILPAYAQEPEYLALFAREAEHASKLTHPNIVQVLDVGSDPTPYLVLELVDGLDLRRLLGTMHEPRLPVGVVTYLALGLAEALSYAHEGGPGRAAVVHRDVSTSNVLVSRGGDVKLADFGLARAVDGGAATQTSAARGKIPYLAPEVMRGGRYTPSADLFAFGVLLYECLAGVRPFDGAHEVETMTRILGDVREPVRARRPDTPDALARLVDDLLAADPAARPSDALEVIERLDEGGSPHAHRLALADLVELRLGGPEERPHVANRIENSYSRGDDLEVDPLELATEAGATGTPGTRGAADDVPTAPRKRMPARAPYPELRREEPQPTGSGTPETLRDASPQARGRRRAAPWVLGAAALLGLGAATVRRTNARRESDTRTLESRVAAAPSNVAPLGREPTASGASEPFKGSTGPATRPTAPRPAPAAPRLDPRSTVASESSAPATPPPPPTTAVAPSGVTPAPAGDDHAAAGPSEPDLAAESEPAQLRITVVPWGSVWIDGRPAGRAPLTVTIAPGPHRVAVGQEGPTVERRVVLAPAQHRVVELELGE